MYIAAVAVAVGVFLPLAKIPVYGLVTYYRIDAISAYIVIGLALFAPALIILAKSRLTFFCSCGIWLTLLFPAIKNIFQSKESGGILDDLMQKARDPLQEFAIDIFMNITDFMWGGYLFIVALLVFTISSLLLLINNKN
jgi:hypothetical protein